MRLEFLQAKGDIVEFIDFLYDQGYYLSQSCGKMSGIILDRQSAKDAQISDLVIYSAVYWIGRGSEPKLLEIIGCNRQSHPRCVGRMGRSAGVIGICHGGEPIPASVELYNSIKKFFKRNYTFQRYNGNARTSCYFGPFYKAAEEIYLQNPEPAHICPGLVRLVCTQDSVEIVQERLQSTLPLYPAIEGSTPVWKKDRDDYGKMELYTSFLCDRSKFDVAQLKELTGKLSCEKSRIIIRNEKRYMASDTIMHKYPVYDVTWYVNVYIEHPWKGFGIF